MNGREKMKQARAKALGRERHPAWHDPEAHSNRYALEPTLIELGAKELDAFWAMYDADPIAERLVGRKTYWSLTEQGRMRQLKIHIRELLSKSGGPLPLP